MDRLISEQAVIKMLTTLFIDDTKFKVAIDALKVIPSAEPYKGMTNGEVFKMLFPQYTYVGVCVLDKNENIILHDINWHWWNSQFISQESEVRDVDNN